MKKDIHPEYREVVFLDTSSEFKFLTRSTIQTKETITWEDGNEYPLVKVEVSSASHPFYTGGKGNFGKATGRVERFNRRYKRTEKKEESTEK
ncbi:type B 50S ribosomal protein L31 [Bernardetia sp.]|uniref:type B 50S ribosomal protein L31 n=1 Tax=Bernardetia sp. TaxID=1937974 RepID=UPI0025BE7A3E|nr:type B 50S ribosomal protein L31 [Bernardetia sp.]